MPTAIIAGNDVARWDNQLTFFSIIPASLSIKLRVPYLKSKIHFQITAVISNETAHGTMRAARTRRLPTNFSLSRLAIPSDRTMVIPTMPTVQIIVFSKTRGNTGSWNRAT